MDKGHIMQTIGANYHEKEKEQNGPGLSAPGMVDYDQRPVPEEIGDIIQARLRQFQKKHKLADALDCVGKLVFHKKHKY